MSLDRKERERNELSSDLFSETDEDCNKDCKKAPNDGDASDSSGNGARFALHTGIFSLDFPPSPKVSKGGKGKKSTTVSKGHVEDSDGDSEVTTVMPTQTQNLTITGGASHTSDSDVIIQPSKFITSRRKKKRSSSRSNESHPKVTKKCNDNTLRNPPAKKRRTGMIRKLWHFKLGNTVVCKYMYCISIAGSPLISSSYLGNTVQYNSMDETDSDAISTQSLTQSGQSNVFGHAKTSRYNRPAHSKKALDRREKIPMRRSNHIQQMKEDKELLDKVRFIFF